MNPLPGWLPIQLLDTSARNTCGEKRGHKQRLRWTTDPTPGAGEGLELAPRLGLGLGLALSLALGLGLGSGLG